MSFVIGLFTVFLVLDCVLLILLVLMQLPKKEAGAGLAFGGGAADALFGAGSGNPLTKITKYAAGAFFVLAMLVSMMQSHYYHRPGTEFERRIKQESAGGSMAPAPTAAPAAAPAASNMLSTPPPGAPAP